MERAAPRRGEGGLLRAAVTVIDGIIAVRLFEACGTAGAPGLRADRAAQPSLGVDRWAGGVEALQEAEPDGLFEVARFGSRGICLGRGFGGEQRAQGGDELVCHMRHDAAAPAEGCRGGRLSLQRGAGLSR